MALTSGSIFQVTATATTGNVNGAGFNPASATFNTDLAATSANTASPVVTSASYTFVAGDVSNYVYVQSGTSWQAGWYPIASVSAGAATLNAAVGAVVLTIGSTGIVTLNTVVGCTSNATATLSGGVFGVDYSQTDTAIATSSTATSSGAGSVILFAGSTQSMIGNFVHVISGTNFTAGWYEIISEVAGVSITTDRAVTTGVGASGVINIGGAGRLNGLEDAFQAMIPSASIVWIKGGSYTLSGAISTASTNSTAILASYLIGFTSIRGDACSGTSRPIFNIGANAVTTSQNQMLVNLIFTGTGSSGVTARTGNNAINCKFINTSVTASRAAFKPAAATIVIGCEAISQNGNAFAPAGAATYVGCYVHDSDAGIVTAAVGGTIISCIIANCVTSGISGSATALGLRVENCTIYGREAKIGTGLNLTGANSSGNAVINNIFYGLTTGITVATGAATTNNSYYNDFFNNGTDVTNWIKDPTDLAVDPTFTSASQITGSTATTSGSVLTAGSIFSGITDSVDYLHVVSGTGVTTGCYLITSHTATTLTVNNALGTSSGGDVVFWVSNGHNFQIGTPLKGIGYPNFINSTNSLTISYPDVGGVERQETGSGGMLVNPGLIGGMHG